MNIDALRKKMNDYFKSVSPEEVVNEFEKRGYVLDNANDVSLSEENSYITHGAHPLGNLNYSNLFEYKEQGNPLLFLCKKINRFTACKFQSKNPLFEN